MRQRFGTVPLNFINGVIGSDRHLVKSYFKVQYDTTYVCADINGQCIDVEPKCRILDNFYFIIKDFM